MQNLLLVNYWDSTVGTMPVNPDGSLLPVTHMYKPPRKSEISRSGPKPTVSLLLEGAWCGSSRAGGRAHSDNDAETAKLRQVEQSPPGA